MYEYSQEEHYKRTGYEIPSPKQPSSFQPYMAPNKLPAPPTTSSIPVSMSDLLHADNSSPTVPSYPYSLPISQPSMLSTAPPPPSSSALFSASIDPTLGLTDPIDFNSSAFLYDTSLFGQIMFDESKFMTPQTTSTPLFGLPQQPYTNTNGLPAGYPQPFQPPPPSSSPPSQQSSPPITGYGKRTWDPVWRS